MSTTARAESEPTSSLSVRELSAAADLRACQDLQRRAFGIAEDGYVVPVALMATASRAGGLVIGAYERGALAGFSFAYLGRIDGEAVLFSQVTAVDPGSQGRGIGRALKLIQRERAREMGLSAVAWTFDPMRSHNAHFNIAVLGATCRKYEVDLYGVRSDALSAGLATDRVFAQWSTRAHTVSGITPWETGIELVELDGADRSRWARPVRVRDLPAHVERAQVEIPSDLDRLKRDEPQLAREWQLLVRQALRSAFDSGFAVVGFTKESGTRYLLRRGC